MEQTEWSIQDLAKAAGVTSRTLRHYDDIGLLPPRRIGGNSYRYYGEAELVRLQQILLLRELGLGLPLIGEVLGGEQDAVPALTAHLRYLECEQERIGTQLKSVRTTIDKIQKGEPLMAAEVFEGFDHSKYHDEVVERWGQEAYDQGDRWWGSLGEQQRKDFGQVHRDLAQAYGKARAAGVSVESAEVLAIAARHYEWIAEAWQRPPSAEAFSGLGEMYVADDRFRANYDVHGIGTAEFVRDAMVAFAIMRLSR